jgi:hypothetical protein
MPPAVRIQSFSQLRKSLWTGVKQNAVSADQDLNLLAAAIIGMLG